MNPPLVSVVIGAYNRERYIRQTLADVFAQTYAPFEVIVVDDASTDQTAGIVAAEFGSRVRLIRRPVNSGLPAVPRNAGLAQATGVYVAFLDSDDGWYPEKLAKQVEFLQAHPDIPVCHTYCHVIDEFGHVAGTRHEGAMPATGDCFLPLVRHCFISISSVMARRDLLVAMGGFNEDPRYRAREDYELFLRIAKQHPVGLIDEVLARYRRASTGISQDDRTWKTRPQDVIAHQLLLERRDIWGGRTTRRVMRQALLDALEENSIWWRERGYSRRALWFAGRALVAAPGRGLGWREGLKSVMGVMTSRPDPDRLPGDPRGVL
jgi:glycosyltransferase involved in cell wall biosynthesis